MSAAPKNSDWKKRESFSSAIIQVVIVGVVLALGVAFIVRRGNNKKEIKEQLDRAHATALKGNVKDLKAGIAVLDEVLASNSSHPQLLAAEAAMYTDLWLVHGEPGADAKAKEFLQKAITAGADNEDRHASEVLHVVATGDAKAAEAAVEKVLARGASSGKLLYAKGLALEMQGNMTLAQVALKAAVEKSWKDPQFASAWGEVILENGTGGALDAFNKSLGNNPDYYRAKLGQALARVMRKDRIGDAAASVVEVQKQEAELSPVLRARALAVAAHVSNIQSEWDNAIALAGKALSVNPKDHWASFAKANALAGKKDPGAGAAFDALIKDAPYVPVFYFEGARNLQAAGMGDAAMNLLSKYESFFKDVKNTTADGKEVSQLSRDDRYWLTRGDVLRENKKLDEAMAAYDKAIEAKSSSISKAYYAKGALLVEQKDYDKAKEILVDITPPDGSGQIAEAYMALGDAMFAKKEYETALQNFVYGLIRMKAQQAPREKMNTILTEVEKRLKTANKKDLAKVWATEAKTYIQ